MLVVGSLGAAPPGTATLETLLAFERCDRVFGAGQAAAAWTALRRGERVGLRVDGPPPKALLERCAKAGIPVTLFPAVSRADLFLARSGGVLGHDLVGLSASRRISALAAKVKTSLPAAERPLKGARVLVTGATGFIGSRLAARLAGEKAVVHALVRDAGRAGTLKRLGAVLLEGDIEDPASLRRAVAESRPEFVFSLAAVREEGADPRRDVKAALLLGDALKGSRLTRWVRTGLRAAADFGLEAEEALHDLLLARYGLPLTTLRLFRVVDARHKAGGPAREGRDLVHVDDVVEAYRLAALRPAAVGRAFDIGSGQVRGKGHAADVAPARKHLGWKAKTLLSLALIPLPVSAFSAPSAVENSTGVIIRADARVDLMAIVQRLSGDDSLGEMPADSPLAAALERFAPYKDHAAVKRLASFKPHGFSGAIPTQYALYLSTETPAPRLFNPKDLQEELAEFRRELDAFRKDTGFDAWRRSSPGIRDGGLEKAAAATLGGRDIETPVARYLGVRSWDRLVIVPSAYVPPGGPSEWVFEEKAGLPDVYIITGPRGWKPEVQFGTVDDLAAVSWYEVLYSLVYVLADRCPGLEPPEGTCRDTSGRGCLQQLWVEPAVRRLVALEFGDPGKAPRPEGKVTKPWEATRAVLARYEKDRAAYPSFFELLPELARAAGKKSCRLVDFSLLDPDYARRLRFYLDYQLGRKPSPSLYKDRAQVRAWLGDGPGALADAEAAARLAPEDAEAWNNVGVLLHRAGRLPEARAALEKALGLGGNAALKASIRSSLDTLLKEAGAR